MSKYRRMATLMALAAASLVVMSSLHFAGADRTKPFDPTRVGLAEASIGVVLGVGAAALLRGRHRARSVAIAATVFAIVGFVIGLTRTTQGGGAIDIG